MAIILLEGCDGSGKSTYANRPEFDNYRKLHFGAYPTPRDAFHAYDDLIEELAEDPTQDVIIDRMHLSERIYGRHFHGVRMSDRRFRYLDDSCHWLGVELIVFDPGWETVRRNWESRIESEMIKDVSKLRAIYDAYRVVGAMTYLSVTTYNFNED